MNHRKNRSHQNQSTNDPRGEFSLLWQSGQVARWNAVRVNEVISVVQFCWWGWQGWGSWFDDVRLDLTALTRFFFLGVISRMSPFCAESSTDQTEVVETSSLGLRGGGGCRQHEESCLHPATEF
jgi:hypothetical protein